MTQQLVVHRRFRGPPQSGNGGYVCGLLARFIDGPAEVTLRAPPPLDRPLDVIRADDAVRLMDGQVLIAEAMPADMDLDVPPPVSYAQAQAASHTYPGLAEHPFPGCFVCSPQRDEGDGLRIFAGAVPGRDIVAAPWTPHPSLVGRDGCVRPEFIWAALDCPGGWSLIRRFPGRHAVLGRLAVRIDAPVVPGRPYVVLAWPMGFHGRKGFAGTALFDESGRLQAAARSTWIRLAQPPAASSDI